jgi:predicted metal-binding membrane protein
LTERHVGNTRVSVGFGQLTGGHLPRRDRLTILVALGAVVGLAWFCLVLGTSQMSMVSGHVGAGMGMMVPSWTATRLLLTFLMWAVMMAAMMLPGATPAILTYAAVVTRIAPAQIQALCTTLFAAAYVLVWAAFSVGATLLQFALDKIGLLSPASAVSSTVLGGSILILTGLYQWAPLKDLCLKHCQTPLTSLAKNWQPGTRGALVMGVQHGIYCVGCCWALMLLLFVGGVMNVLWVAGISLFVLLEKLAGVGSRRGQWISGTCLVMLGIGVIAG